jgi:hypothetical protein
MMPRVIPVMATVAAVAFESLVLATPVGAQRTGTIEVGGFARYIQFDRSLAMGNTVGVGARVTVYTEPVFAFELDVAHASGRSVAYTPVHLRGVYNPTADAGFAPLLGVGFVRNVYGLPLDAADYGVSGLVGFRYRVGNRVWLRVGADLDTMFHTTDNTRFLFYNGTWGVHFGASTRVN